MSSQAPGEFVTNDRMHAPSFVLPMLKADHSFVFRPACAGLTFGFKI